MPLNITFTLSDSDLQHFQQVIDRAKSAMNDNHSNEEIEKAARQLIADAKADGLPDFITDRLAKLQVVIDMLGDEEWKLGEAERERVLSAMMYFCDPDDLIPDDVPGLGFLDDAIYVELMVQELKLEIGSYEEFCQFRDEEEKRRRKNGLDPHVQREDWLADKRASLHASMKSRRNRSMTETGSWRLLW